ncbi:ChaN family lipoprotein [Ruegeria hyattellae]|uniref:ChaN family lipoprotein n=1 Tax=Ruegeria hyattellae TaxID=3233337 RepID=UPI00355C2422
MRHAFVWLVAVAVILAAPFRAAFASDLIPQDILDRMKQADVVILGEFHDNPRHHQIQAEAVRALQPNAVVWEMLTAEGAVRVNRNLISDEQKLAIELKWEELGWPPLAMYLDIFRAAPDAPLHGALVPRVAAHSAMERGAAVALGADAARYGLTVPLPPEEQAARIADQHAAHCEALPEEMLPQMVEVQRLRDAVLARATIEALDDDGAPVVVITGNGHARKDRGIPVYLARRRPGVNVFVLGQSEDGRLDGDFDAVIDSPPAEREDPCKTFE